MHLNFLTLYVVTVTSYISIPVYATFISNYFLCIFLLNHIGNKKNCWTPSWYQRIDVGKQHVFGECLLHGITAT